MTPDGDRGRTDAALRSGDFLKPHAALVVLGAIPVLALAAVAYVVSARAMEAMVYQGNDAAALITASLVEREFDQWEATVTSHADVPTLRSAVDEGNVDAVRRHLEILVSAHARLDRAFVTDTTGLLWSDFPAAPESLGRRFDDRAWFRGVREGPGPHVSEVYRRNAEPAIQVVAVAVPVRSPASDVPLGFLVAQVRLDGLSELLGRVEVGDEGSVLLLDHTGALAAHPSLDLERRRYEEYAEVAVSSPTPSATERGGRYTDPVTGQEVLASSVQSRVGPHDWTVIAQQSVASAFAPIRTLSLQLGAAGLLMCVLMGVLLRGVARETARRRRAEEDLVAVNEELERRVEEGTSALEAKESELMQAQKMEAVGQLAGGVAHDFNNLLTVIMGSTDLVLLELGEDAPERGEIEDIRHAAARGAELTRQLLAFSRKQVLQPEILDVNEAVERMRSLLDRVLGAQIDLVWRLSPELHPVKFDPVQIEQIVMNLAVNARDAMPRGGKLTIETANVDLDDAYVEDHVDAQPGPHVVLAVTDTGHGIDAETRRRIFEPFFTTKRSGRGTGLGLSTVYGIVRQGGGNIWVYSEPGRGTTFKVYLPRTTDVPHPKQGPAPPTTDVETGTILVVEDDDAVRALLVRILRGAGYEVLEASDAETAVAALRACDGDVDLLLTDVVLPDTSGPDVAARLEREQGDLEVLYMSGYTDNAIVHHGVLDEGTAFIEKPFRPRTLLEKVREALGA
ncbi:MAG: ATP-binding protein [Gemmatimonadota bacterium]|nr:ATP-binding protein [Gemmatimonadota bacterium]